jgi:hypothetical protein
MSLSDTRARYADPEIAHEDPSLGTAIERVFDAGQSLLSRRIDLLVEELAAQSWRLFAASICAVIGMGMAFAGWFLAIAGLINALDGRFERFHVQFAIGAAHVALGAAIVLIGRRRLVAKVST